jgi:hypothetical protein
LTGLTRFSGLTGLTMIGCVLPSVLRNSVNPENPVILSNIESRPAPITLGDFDLNSRYYPQNHAHTFALHQTQPPFFTSTIVIYVFAICQLKKQLQIPSSTHPTQTPSQPDLGY